MAPTPSDLESGTIVDIPGLYNDIVTSFKWRDITATIPAQRGRPEKVLLAGVSGIARAGEYPSVFRCTELITGELVAIMGPSGSGKTMLLYRLAHRAMPPSAKMTGDVFINQTPADIGRVRQTSSYVEQQDHLIGSITTSETLKFAAKLGLSE